MLSDQHRIAILLHNGILGPTGKTGLTMLRYSRARIVAVIDRECAGKNLEECTGISRQVPIVESVAAAEHCKPDVLVIGIAPPGGRLPQEWKSELQFALRSGLCLVNGLHTRLATDQELKSCMRNGQWIWDVRQEPPDLSVARGEAARLTCRRVLTVGTDMAVGKKCVALEMNEQALKQGLKSKFLATGQSGIMISGEGVALDSVRVDYAASAIEQMVLRNGHNHDILFLEGQGSLLHPGSSATLPLLRGMQPTHMIMVHRAGQKTLRRFPELTIPPLKRVIRLYQETAAAGGVFHPSRMAAVVLNTFHLSPEEAEKIISLTSRLTGLPCTDPVRFGAETLLNAVLE